MKEILGYSIFAFVLLCNSLLLLTSIIYLTQMIRNKEKTILKRIGQSFITLTVIDILLFIELSMSLYSLFEETIIITLFRIMLPIAVVCILFSIIFLTFDYAHRIGKKL